MKTSSTRKCLLCEAPDASTDRIYEKFICLGCLERGRAGRDTTTKAARALKVARRDQATADLYRAHGDDASAESHEHSSGTYAAKAEDLFQPSLGHTLAMGEAVPAKDSRLADTLKVPNVAGLDASAHRLELLGHLGLDCTAMALDAADTIKADNSLEKMLAHQLAAAHKVAMEITAKGTLQHDSIEKTRMLNLACRMMETYQRGLLTLQRLRSNGEQKITVQYVTVADGAQAIVGNVKVGECGK